MKPQTFFKRHELKFVINNELKEIIINTINPYMEIDKYKKTTIKNIYFDTDDYLLIRRSIDKPIYKEKLRIRTYVNQLNENNTFVELKKKYNHVVYKRRLEINEKIAMDWLTGKIDCPYDTQVAKEIDYFYKLYKGLKPLVFLSYDREAYYEKNGGDLRITFDDNILFRDQNINLSEEPFVTAVLENNQVIMEIKTTSSLPIWIVDILSKHHIYKTSFSKYGTIYKNIIFNKIKNNYLDEKETA